MIEYAPFPLIPDVLQAESERYGQRVLHLLRLDSGRFAVLGPMCKLFAIADTWEEAEQAAGEIPPPAPTIPYRPPLVSGVNLNEIELDL